MGNKKLWEKCVDFHGHECGGLAIGYQAALYALELLGISAEDTSGNQGCVSKEEELVCIAENDACGVDAVQVILGCSIGKGNLLFHMCGKQAFSFYNRRNGKSVRLVLKARAKGMTREESLSYYQTLRPEELFDVKETKIALPERARIFQSVVCSCCKETVSENMIRIQGEKMLCLDCYKEYNRFSV